MSNKNNMVLSRHVRIVIIIIMILALILSTALTFSNVYEKGSKKVYYTYSTQKDAKYKVYLLKNDFYTESYLTNKQYPAELIDYISIDLSYMFKGNKKSNISYSYSVDASIVSEYEATDVERAEIWRRNYSILAPQYKNIVSDNKFDINQNVIINYKTYNDIVNQYKARFKLAIDAYLSVKLNINYEGTIDENDKPISGKDTVELDIPLSKAAVNIKSNNDSIINKNLTENISKEVANSKFYIGVILLVIDIFAFMAMFDKIFVTKKSLYIKTLTKILKDYEDIIVEVKSRVDVSDLKVIEIKTFDDLVDLEEEFKSPILVYEVEKDRECEFIVTNDKYAYIYVLNNKKN